MKYCILLFALIIAPFINAQITFSEDIAPIIYQNCTNCHRTGEIAPFALTNYTEVSNWAAMIKYVTGIGYMPPWSADEDYRHFVGERVLTDSEIQLIADWVDGGALQGDPNLEPPLPTFTSGSQIGNPDVVLTMSEAHNIVGNNQDDYRVFVLPSGFLTDKEISSIEFRSGNTSAVHHVLYAYDVTGTANALDAATIGYGYSSFGDFGFSEAVYLPWSYVPGNAPLVFPEGIGEVIPANADLLIQVHYAPIATNETDSSSVNIFFKDANDPIVRQVKTAATLPFNLPGGFFSFNIPANQVKTFTAEGHTSINGWIPVNNQEVSLIGINPHMHLLGKSYEIFVVTPQNDTINLIKIPEWDFNWQGAYTFENMIRIPANSEWFTIATYDNTSSNPSNPNFPPQNTNWGEGTEDEMLVVFFYYVNYQNGDELTNLSGIANWNNCEDIIDLEAYILPNDTIKSDSIIFTSGKVTYGTNVTLQAESKVELKQGFETEVYNNINVKIENCD